MAVSIHGLRDGRLGTLGEQGAASFANLLTRFGTPEDTGLSLDWSSMQRAGWALVPVPGLRGLRESFVGPWWDLFWTPPRLMRLWVL